MTFRERLREEIELSGLLDKEVAAKAGITKRTMDSYVGSRACMPGADVAVRLAKTLGVSVEYLVTGTDSNFHATLSDAQTQKLVRSFVNLSKRDKTLLLSLASSMEQTQ